MKKNIIVLGSSRSYGNTRKAVTDAMGENDIPLIDLGTHAITPFDYEYRNKSDDFIPLIERIVEFDTIVVATPVYWYTMSAIMKTFIDRITDLLYHRKDLGHQLRGKKAFVIASFGGATQPKGFEDSFEQTFNYLNMPYLGTSFIYSGTENAQFLKNNQSELEKAKAIFH